MLCLTGAPLSAFPAIGEENLSSPRSLSPRAYLQELRQLVERGRWNRALDLGRRVPAGMSPAGSREASLWLARALFSGGSYQDSLDRVRRLWPGPGNGTNDAHLTDVYLRLWRDCLEHPRLYPRPEDAWRDWQKPVEAILKKPGPATGEPPSRARQTRRRHLWDWYLDQNGYDPGLIRRHLPDDLFFLPERDLTRALSVLLTLSGPATNDQKFRAGLRDRLLEKLPGQAGQWRLRLGSALLTLGERKAAARFFREGWEKKKLTVFLERLGQLRLAQGRRDQAFEIWRTPLREFEANSQSPTRKSGENSARLRSSDLFFKNGYYPEALKILREAKKPDSFIRRRQARVYLVLEDYRAALEIYVNMYQADELFELSFSRHWKKIFTEVKDPRSLLAWLEKTYIQPEKKPGKKQKFLRRKILGEYLAGQHLDQARAFAGRVSARDQDRGYFAWSACREIHAYAGAGVDSGPVTQCYEDWLKKHAAEPGLQTSLVWKARMVLAEIFLGLSPARKSPPADREKARELLDQAGRVLAALDKQDPDSALLPLKRRQHYFFLRGILAGQEGQPDQARTWLRKSGRVGFEWWLRLDILAGRLEEAATRLEDYSEHSAHYYRGIIHFLRGEFRPARAQFYQMIRYKGDRDQELVEESLDWIRLTQHLPEWLPSKPARKRYRQTRELLVRARFQPGKEVARNLRQLSQDWESSEVGEGAPALAAFLDIQALRAYLPALSPADTALSRPAGTRKQEISRLLDWIRQTRQKARQHLPAHYLPYLDFLRVQLEKEEPLRFLRQHNKSPFAFFAREALRDKGWRAP